MSLVAASREQSTARSRNLKHSLAVGVCIILLILVSSCADSASTWQRIEDSGTLRIGLDPTFPPFESIDESGLVGVDVDLAEAVAEALELELEILHFGYDGLYDALLTGQVDALISAMTILPERTEDFTYSVPYYDAGQYLFSRKDSYAQTLEQIDMAGIAVELGSEGHVLANQFQRSTSDAEVIVFKSASEALQSVVDGDSDVAIVDSITGRLFINSAPSLRIRRRTSETTFLLFLIQLRNRGAVFAQRMRFV